MDTTAGKRPVLLLHMGQEGFCRNDLPGMQHEICQQMDFGGSEIQRLPAGGDLVQERVQTQAAQPDGAVPLVGETAQETPYPGFQFPEGKGFCEIVVGAQIQAQDLIRAVAAGREDQHLPLRVLDPDELQQIQPIHAG